MRLGIAKRHRFVELSPCVHSFLLAVQPPLNSVGRFLQSTLTIHAWSCSHLVAPSCRAFLAALLAAFLYLSSTFLAAFLLPFSEAFLAALL